MGILWISNFKISHWVLLPWAAKSNRPPEKNVQTPKDRWFQERIYQHLEQHYKDCEYSVSQLSRDIGMSRSQLFRKCRSVLGQSPVNLIKTYRLNKAKEFLNSGIYNVSEAAYLSGFNSLSYFSKSFKKHYQQMPSKWLG